MVLTIRASKKYEMWLKNHLEHEHPKTRGRMERR